MKDEYELDNGWIVAIASFDPITLASGLTAAGRHPGKPEEFMFGSLPADFLSWEDTDKIKHLERMVEIDE